MEQPKTHQEADLKAVLETKKKLCFICNNLCDTDDNKDEPEGLGRCTEKRGIKKLYDGVAIYLSDTLNRFYNAAD